MKKNYDSDPTYFDVKMSDDEIWRVLESLYKMTDREEIRRLSYLHGELTGHLIEVLDK